MYRAEKFVFSDGERYPMLVDGMGMPHFWVTLFISVQVRLGVQANTISSYISDIRHFLLWEEVNNRDILLEMRKLQFLSDSDFADLRDHCLLKTSDIKKWHRQKNTPVIRKINEGFPVSPRLMERVGGATAANRLSRIAEYLSFVARALLRNRPNITDINKKIDQMKARLLDLKPPTSNKGGLSSDPNQKAPPPEVFQEFLLAVQPQSPNNPYKNSIVKKRNWIMFNILDATGMRGGEVLGLKVEDIDYHQNLICIVRRHDDPDDKRRDQPTAKTLSRNIPTTEDLIEQILDYIDNERAQTKGANKHPYLFVTHQKGPYVGSALSISGFEKAVTSAVSKVAQAADSFEKADLIEEIHKHGFRHNFNYMLSLKFDKHNKLAKSDPSMDVINERGQNQIRMHMNGWTSEETAGVYNLRHTRELANKLMLDDMPRLSAKIKTRRDGK